MSYAILERLKAHAELPSPTGVALRVLELARDEKSTIEEIAKAVELDPALALKLLRIVNSPLAGASRQIASVPRAASLLGVRAVTSLALGFSLISGNRRGRCSGFNYELFWSKAVARAVAARHVVTRLRNFSPDEAFSCGLLSEIGRLALASVFPEPYSHILAKGYDEESQELWDLERGLAGVDHMALSAAMLESWHLPAVFCEGVRIHRCENGNESVPPRVRACASVLHLSRLVALTLTQPDVYAETTSRVVLAANALGIFPDAFHLIFDSIAEEWREMGAIVSVKTRLVPPLAALLSEAADRRGELETAMQANAPTLPAEGSAHACG